MTFWTIVGDDRAVIAAQVESDGAPDPATYGGSACVAISAPIDPASSVWNGASWAPDMAALRERKWREVWKLRDEKINAGITVDGYRYDSDASARANVMGAAIAAQAALAVGEPFSVEWTLADNSSVTRDAVQMIAVHVTGVAIINALYERARALRDAIDASPDIAELDAIDIEQGWPE